MSDNGFLKTAAVLVGIIAGIIGIYRAFRPAVDTGKIRSQAAYLQPLNATIEKVEGKRPVLSITVQNLSKEGDAIDTKLTFEDSGNSIWNVNRTEPLIRPNEQTTIRYYLNDGRLPMRSLTVRNTKIPFYFDFEGSITWHDRVSDGDLTSRFCFEGMPDVFKDGMNYITKDQDLKQCPSRN